MKATILFCLLVCPLSAQTTAQKTNTPAEVKIPAGAVKTEDGSYKFSDSSGKKWIYRVTPFGVARSEDKAVDDTVTPFGKAQAKPEPVVVIKGKDPAIAYDEGDNYRFERTTPFGTTVWRKKKTDLNDTEKNILNQQKSKAQ